MIIQNRDGSLGLGPGHIRLFQRMRRAYGTKAPGLGQNSCRWALEYLRGFSLDRRGGWAGKEQWNHDSCD